ncbi:MAG: hypothetical protein JO057_18185 [Chloroflexi bacterium]|nr:hypothetical protein [Chloroflexota bacterium]
MHAIGIFEPALVGVPAAVIGIVFMVVVGRWLLPTPKIRADAAVDPRFVRAEFHIKKQSLQCAAPPLDRVMRAQVRRDAGH